MRRKSRSVPADLRETGRPDWRRSVYNGAMRNLANLLSFVTIAGVVCVADRGVAADREVTRREVARHEVDFNREVRPILAKHCLTCHGPDDAAREAGLRLDTQAGGREDLGGYQAIVPGDAEDSEVILRVTSDDPDLRMPPGDSHEPLSAEEIGTLRRWIDQGGRYQTHWAFVPPQRPVPPEPQATDWCGDAIDAFVLSRMTAEGLRPSPPAEPAAWLRRVYSDLTGTVPTPEQTQRFVDDDHPLARRRVVDHLLASPDFAERFARPWLDLARYADTNGYEKDRPRTIWPYRDWVLNAVNDDMPFDEFTIEQLAGDMLPDATTEQRVATGFHRNTMLNEEGGIDPLEFRWLAVVDRVATTGTTWLGLTTGCAQCHTHKYDPITHTDYYRLFALLNNADEPELEVPIEDREDESSRSWERQPAIDRVIEQWLAGAEAETIEKCRRVIRKDLRNGRRAWNVLRPTETESTMPTLTCLDDGTVLASGDVRKRDTYTLRFELPNSVAPVTSLRLEVLPHESLPAGGPGMAYYEGRRGDFFLSEWTARLNGRPQKLDHASHTFGKITVGSGGAKASGVIDGEGSTGWSTAGEEAGVNVLVVNFAEPIQVSSDSGAGELEIELLFERHFAAALGCFRLSYSTDPGVAVASDWHGIDAPFAGDAPEPSELLRNHRLRSYAMRLVRHHAELKTLRDEIEKVRNAHRSPPRTLVMRERPATERRATYRHHRGEYLQPEEPVEPENLSLFTSLAPRYSQDRLGLARFLASPDNPLVGRVQTNRIWRHFFGAGIVRTAGDFGTQSEPPSHPNLIDHLAVDWMDGGWSTKRLVRSVVLSSTYGQAIGPAPAVDPDNRLLSVFPYRRLDAEAIRDTMLSASGLLCRPWGGPSVHPPQPASVSRMAYGRPNWPASTGADRFRRSLYTFSRRTAPFAALTTFDAPTGELCQPRRDSSTNPLQALTLLNDAMFVEIAEALAREVTLGRGEVETRSDEVRAIADEMFRRVLVRPPGDEELQAICQFFEKSGDWTLVARAILNLDETITVP